MGKSPVATIIQRKAKDRLANVEKYNRNFINYVLLYSNIFNNNQITPINRRKKINHNILKCKCPEGISCLYVIGTRYKINLYFPYVGLR